MAASANQPTKSFLDLVNDCDSFPYVDIPSLASSANPPATGAYYAFHLANDPRPHGFIPAHVVQQMPWTDAFAVSPDGQLPRTVTLLDTTTSSNGPTTTPAAAGNHALHTLIQLAQDQGHFATTLGRKAPGEDFQIMGTTNPITTSPTDPARFQLRRAAAALFGIANRGAHLTAYVRDPASGQLRIWVPRRSRHLATYPGMLDNTVAGGVRAEESPLECIVHEADEEASLPAAFVRAHVRPAGAVTYITQTGSGGGTDKPSDVQTAVGGFDAGLCVPDVLYLYDLELPDAESMVPRPQDDEVEAFYLWDVPTVQAAMRRGEFKPNTVLVLLDFFVRHGIVTQDNEEEYLEIVTRMHRKLPVPLTARERSV